MEDDPLKVAWKIDEITLSSQMSRVSSSSFSSSTSSPITGKSLEFVDFQIVVQLIHRQIRTEISWTTIRKSTNLRLLPVTGRHNSDRRQITSRTPPRSSARQFLTVTPSRGSSRKMLHEKETTPDGFSNQVWLLAPCTGRHVRLIQTFCWHKNISSVAEQTPHTKTKMQL